MSNLWSHNRFAGSSRTPTFQPPSFYAAAAGMPYPSSPAVNSPSLTSGNMYPSMPLADRDSNSAREHIANTTTETHSRRRSVSLSRSLLPGSHRPDKDKVKHGRNKSQLADIPFLETSLLPSLRDTIDKMTHPPRIPAQEPMDTPSHPREHAEFAPSPGVSSRTKRNHLTTDMYRDTGRSPVQFSGYSPMASPLMPGNTKTASSGIRSPQVTTPKTAYSNPKPSPSRLERESPAMVNSGVMASTTSRSALKSSYHAPQISSMLSPASTPAPTSPLPGKSLRSVKNIIPSTLTPSAPSSSQYRSPKIKSPSTSRSADKSVSLRPDALAGTPHSKYKTTSPAFSVSQSASSSRSQIPVSNRAGDSGSELEREYGRSLASGKLVVTNAIIEPSDSDSDTGQLKRSTAPSQSRLGTPESRLRTPKDLRSSLLQRVGGSPRTAISRSSPSLQPDLDGRSRRTDPIRHTPTVGLGFRMYPERQRQSFHEIQDDDDHSVYEDEDGMDPPGSSKIQDFTQPPRKLVEYADDEESVYDDSDVEHLDPCIGLQRQQALMGLVDGLQLDFGLHSENNRLSHSDSDGQYHVDGLAIGGSADLAIEQRLNESTNSRRTGSRENRDTRRHSRSRDRRDSVAQQETSYIPPSKPPSTISISSRISEGKRDSRSGSVQPTSRSSSRQDVSTRDKVPTQPEQESRTSTSRSTSAKTKSRHRVSMSVGRLTDNTRNSSNETRPPKVRRNSSHQRDSWRVSGEYKSTENRSSDLIMREIEGFGIPASLSYGGIGSSEGSLDELEKRPKDSFVRSASENSVSSVEELCRVGSNLSGAENDRCLNTAGGLSRGAEALFQNLSTGSQSAMHRRRESLRRDTSGTQSKSPKSSRRRSSSVPSRRSPSPTVSLMQNPWSPEQRQIPEELVPLDHQAQNHATWRSTMRPSTYQALLTKHGPVEMQRQELLYEQYLCQQEFVKRLRSILRVFILPLRRKHSKSWVSGIPVQVSRLFDWLEDIVNLHASIADAIESLSHAWGSGIVVYAAQSIRGLVPRFEVYQPYLVRVDEVRHMLTQDSIGDEFTEFVKMRERHIECGGWTLADLLHQPVERLSDFVAVCQHLLELTPREHPDHLASFSLYHSIWMLVHVLHEVKSREEEYQFVKDLAFRIENLLPSVQLAKRERRLLWQGGVTCCFEESPPQDTSLIKPPSEVHNHAKRQPTDIRRRENRGRSSSFNSSALPPLSQTKSGYSPLGPVTPAWNQQDITPSIVLSPCPNVLGADEQDRWDERGTPKVGTKTTRTTNAHCFAFTDVLILAEPIFESEHQEPRWRLLSGVGMSRVLGIADGEPLSLDLLSLSPSDLHTGVIPEGSSTSIVRVSLSPDKGATRDGMLIALQRCYAYTLRSLSFPSHSGHYLPHGAHVDLEHDTQQSVMSILNTGLPLPKSPSVQMSDMERLRSASTGNETDQEREERGWWTLRFQQVLKEMQRQDPMIALEMINQTHI